MTASARSRKHLCGKQTCAGCRKCADPGPHGECGPCAHDVTSVDIVTEHLCGHRACDNAKHRQRASELLDALGHSPTPGANGDSGAVSQRVSVLHEQVGPGSRLPSPAVTPAGTRGGLRGSAVRLAIADPPYPPFVGSGGRRNRASRWYGTGQVSAKDRPADQHPAAAEWDDPARHRRLLLELANSYDGWAIATSPDGLAAYGPLPAAARILAWVKPNAAPGAHRLRSLWEPVILYPPASRRSNRNGAGMVPDVLTAALPRERTFIGAKPPAWTRWVLDALGHDPTSDTVDDLFPGSGAVAAALAAGVQLSVMDDGTTCTPTSATWAER